MAALRARTPRRRQLLRLFRHQRPCHYRGGPAAAASADEAKRVPERPWRLLPLSARNAPALKALAQAYAQRVEALPSVAAFADVCYTAGVGRSHLEHRAAIVAEDPASAARLLAALAEERPLPGVHMGVSADPPKTAWLFTGQGSQMSAWAASSMRRSRLSARR